MTEEKVVTKIGNIILENRKSLLLSGVTDTESFDENLIVLYTNCGKLTIGGSELHITKLSVETGDVAIDGNVTSLVYSEGKKKTNENFLSKLFK